MKMLGLLAASLFAASVGSAQEQPPPGMVPLRLSGDAPDLRFEVSAGRKAPVQSCAAPCTIWVWPGVYRVKMRGPGVSSTGREVSPFGPTSVDGSAGASGNRITGLVLGASGAAAVLVGFAGLILSEMSEGSREQSRSDKAPWLVTMGLGAATSAIGWTLFGTNRSTLSATPSARLAVVPTLGGAALGFGGRF